MHHYDGYNIQRGTHDGVNLADQDFNGEERHKLATDPFIHSMAEELYVYPQHVLNNHIICVSLTLLVAKELLHQEKRHSSHTRKSANSNSLVAHVYKTLHPNNTQQHKTWVMWVLSTGTPCSTQDSNLCHGDSPNFDENKVKHVPDYSKTIVPKGAASC